MQGWPGCRFSRRPEDPEAGLPARFCKSFSFFPSLSAILKPAAIRAAARGKDRYRCTAVRENGFFNGAEGGPRGQQKCVGYPAGGWKLLRLPANKTICPYGHEDLEPGSFSGRPRFADSHTGEREDFPGKEQAEAGILPVSLVEDLLLFVHRYANPVILPYDDKPFRIFPCRYPDRCCMFLHDGLCYPGGWKRPWK